MTIKRNSSSTVKATKGNNVLYLSQRDESNGVDIELDMKGYTIVAL